ncbi:glucan phosphoethanolaminetransferase (alkaline phosphatase superfamily) [Paenibacillus polymyxa]
MSDAIKKLKVMLYEILVSIIVLGLMLYAMLDIPLLRKVAPGLLTIIIALMILCVLLAFVFCLFIRYEFKKMREVKSLKEIYNKQ